MSLLLELFYLSFILLNVCLTVGLTTFSWWLEIVSFRSWIESGWTRGQTIPCCLNWLSVNFTSCWRQGEIWSPFARCSAQSILFFKSIHFLSWSSFDFNLGIVAFSYWAIHCLRNLLVIHDSLTYPFQWHSWLKHMHKECSLVILLVLRDIIIKLEITSSNSYHQFVTSHLNDVLLTSNKVALALNISDRKVDVQLGKLLQNFLLDDTGTLSFFNVKLDWVHAEEFITFLIDLLLS